MEKKGLFFGFLIFLFMVIINSSYIVCSDDDPPDTTDETIYVCDDISSQGFLGETKKYGSFIHNSREFSSPEYDNIKSDDENYIYSYNSSTNNAQYNLFNFTINENISNITNIKVTWKGYGGVEDITYPPSPTIYGYGLWIKINQTYQMMTYAQSGGKDNLTLMIDSNFSDVIHDSHISIGACSIIPGAIGKSFLYSYYIEVKITYLDSSDNELLISNDLFVNEGEYFRVMVTSEDVRLEDVMVNFSGNTYYTDQYGVINILSPQVDHDTVYLITAFKKDYLPDQSNITIKNNEIVYPELEISNEPFATEGDSFRAMVTSDGIIIHDVLINFSGSSYSTGSIGVVDIIAPDVEKNSIFFLTAFKEGYVSDEGSILILDTDNVSIPQLNFDTPSSVIEGDDFDISVTFQGYPIEDSMVNFSGSVYFTNNNGIITLTAPSVEENIDLPITAFKQAYSEVEKYINIIDGSTTRIEILYPKDRVTLSGMVNVQWQIINKPPDPFYITLLYKENSNWITLFENDNSDITFYSWDTTTVENGDSYKLKIIIDNGETSFEDISDEFFLINNQIEPTNGWIYGTVFENSVYQDQPIEGALVCFYHEKSISTKKRCVFTDRNGNYNLSIAPGSYYGIAGKIGYLSDTKKDIEVVSNKEIKSDFILNKTNVKEIKSLVEHKIDEEIKRGSIIGKVDIIDDDEISIYDDIDIEVTSNDINSENGINIIISGEGNPGTKIVVYLGYVEDPEEIIVTYDGIIINPTYDIESFFEVGYDKNEYVISTVIDQGISKNILIINNPHFSEHQITISLAKITETLSFLSGIIYYIIFLVLIGILFVGFGMIRKKY